MVKKSSRKGSDLMQLLIAVVAVLLINIIASFQFIRLDLTNEGRYSLSDATKNILTTLEDVVYIKVYLYGDLPPAFERLEQSTREMIEEFDAYAGDKLVFEFIDPSAEEDEEIRNGIYQELTDAGIQYNNLYSKKGDARTEQIIFPGAIFTYRDKEEALQILKSQNGTPPEVMLNNSIQQLEYEMAQTIQKLTRIRKPNIAFLDGNSTLITDESADLARELSQLYKVVRLPLSGKYDALSGYDALVIAKPDSAFSEKDKFIIDQFIMLGGNVLWFIDAVNAEMDSLRLNPTFLGTPKDLNLDDMLFNYGIRINKNLVMDMEALKIPIVTGMIGNQPRQELFPWPFFPLLTHPGKHPIATNLEPVMTQFASSLDTVGTSNIKKTVLLTSSGKTKLSRTPSRISLNMVRLPLDERQYQSGKVPVAVLLEGKFKSVYRNRLAPEYMNNPQLKFREQSLPTKMIVVADGDLPRNLYSPRTDEYFPMGYDRISRRVYGNASFVMNAINYMLDDTDLIAARSKEFKIRLLNQEKVEKEKSQWQILNLALPLTLIAIFAIISAAVRRRRFAS